jgi:hypothetical protein
MRRRETPSPAVWMLERLIGAGQSDLQTGDTWFLS